MKKRLKTLLLLAPLFVSCGEPEIELDPGPGLIDAIESTPKLKKETARLREDNDRLENASEALNKKVEGEELKKDLRQRISQYQTALLSNLSDEARATAASESVDSSSESLFYAEREPRSGDWRVHWPSSPIETSLEVDKSLVVDSKGLLFAAPEESDSSEWRGPTIRIYADHFVLPAGQSIETNGHHLVIVADSISIAGKIKTTPQAEDGFFRVDGEDDILPPASGDVIFLSSVIDLADTAVINASGAKAERFETLYEDQSSFVARELDQAVRSLMATGFRRQALTTIMEDPPAAFETESERELLSLISHFFTTRVRFDMMFDTRQNEIPRSAMGGYDWHPAVDLYAGANLEEVGSLGLFKMKLSGRQAYYNQHRAKFEGFWENLIVQKFEEKKQKMARLRERGNRPVEGRDAFFMLRHEHGGLGLSIQTSRFIQEARSQNLRLTLPSSVQIQGNVPGGDAGSVHLVSVNKIDVSQAEANVLTKAGEGLKELHVNVRESLESGIDQSRALRVVNDQYAVSLPIEVERRAVFYVGDKIFVSPDFTFSDEGETHEVVDIDFMQTRRQFDSSYDSDWLSEPRPGVLTASQSEVIENYQQLVRVAEQYGIDEGDYPDSWKLVRASSDVLGELEAATFESVDQQNQFLQRAGLSTLQRP